MSNWYAFLQNSQPSQFPKSRQGKAFYFLLSTVLILVSSWFMWFVLETGETPNLTPDIQSSTFMIGFSPSVQYWEDEILSWADTYSLDPYLVATVMQIESCGNPQAVSPAGAQGLFQVMPYHFNSGENMLDPEINALRGLTYLCQSFEKAAGDLRLTFAGYNGGHGQIERPKADWPDETKQYVIWGSGIYEDALDGKQDDPTFGLWLDAGGLQLCQEAERILNLP